MTALRALAPLSLAAALLSCDLIADPPPGNPAASLEAVSGSGQAAAVATSLGAPLGVVATDEAGRPVANATVTWTVTAGTIEPEEGRTDEAGRAEAVWTLGERAGGDTAVASVRPNATANFAAIAMPGAPVSLDLTPDELLLDALGSSRLLEVSAFDAYGNVAAPPVEWSSSDTAVAEVNAAGWVRSRAAGTAVIRVTSGGLVDSAEVEVGQIPHHVIVEPAAAVATAGTTQQFTARVVDRSGSEVPGAAAALVWSVSNPAVAEPDADGTVTMLRDGQVVVTAAIGELAGQALATITAPGTPALDAWRLANSVTDARLALSGTAADNIFLVGSGGEAFQYDGVTLSPLETGVDTDLNAVWAVSATEAIAVGVDPDTAYKGFALHYDGAAWEEKPLPPGADYLDDLWGAAPDDVWAVGNAGDILHYDGLAWTQQVDDLDNHLGFSGIWGRSSTDVYAVLTRAILHYDGVEWTRIEPEGDGVFYDVWATAESVFAVGYSDALNRTLMLRFDGSEWTTVEEASGIPGRFVAVGGSGPGEIYAAGFSSNPQGQPFPFLFHFNGTSWNEVPAAAEASYLLQDIWGAGTGQVYLSGEHGAFVAAAGPDLQEINHESTTMMWSLWGASDADIFAVGRAGTILHYDGTGWTAQESGTGVVLRTVWGIGPDAVFAGGERGTVLAFDGTSWNALPPIEGDVSAVWGVSATDLYAAGGDHLYHFDGIEWRETPVVKPEGFAYISPTIKAFYGFGPDSVLAVGSAIASEGCVTCQAEYAVILRFDGSAWQATLADAYSDLSAVWGSAADDLYAVGRQGLYGALALHYDGSQWTAIDLPLSAVDGPSLHSVWGTAPNDIYVGGDSGALLRYDGVQWTSLPTGTKGTITGLWGTSTGPAWGTTYNNGGGAILMGERP